MALIDKLTAIGNAIRDKLKESDKYTLDEMANKISELTNVTHPTARFTLSQMEGMSEAVTYRVNSSGKLESGYAAYKFPWKDNLDRLGYQNGDYLAFSFYSTTADSSDVFSVGVINDENVVGDELEDYVYVGNFKYNPCTSVTTKNAALSATQIRLKISEITEDDYLLFYYDSYVKKYCVEFNVCVIPDGR